MKNLLYFKQLHPELVNNIIVFFYSKRRILCSLLYIFPALITLQIPATFAAYSTKESPLTAHSNYDNIDSTHGGLTWTSDMVMGKNILVIHAWHEGDKETNGLMQGIYDKFEESGVPVVFSVEYMDTKRFPYRHHLENLESVYKYKYANKRFDVIIASGEAALDFILHYRTKMFHTTPIVFSDVSDLDPVSIKKHDGVTGVMQSYDVLANIELALEYHPNTRKVVVLSHGEHNKKIFDAIRNKLPDSMRFFHWKDLYLSDIEKKIKTLGSDAILIPVKAPRTKAGTNMPYGMFVERIAKVSNAPVYVLWDTALGSGAIGGKLVSSHAQGQTAAQLALRIMRGENASEVPIVTDSPNRYMFDYLQLQRFNINVADLPQNSIVINKPFSIYEMYRKEINLAIILVLTQAGIICLLIISIKRRKQAEMALKSVNDELEQRVTRRTEQISNANSQLLKEIQVRREVEETLREMNMALSNAMPGIAKLDTQGRYIFVNDIYAEILGYSPEELIGLSWEPMVHPHDLHYAIAAYNVMLSGEKGEFEVRAVRKDGSEFYKHVLMVKITDDGGEFIGHHCFMRDITERKQAEEELQNSRERLRNLATRLQAVREEERTRLAREIHDELGQALTGLKIDLTWLREHMPKNLKKLLTRVDAMISLVDAKVDDTRKLAFRLRPAILDDLGLEAAIECEVQYFAERTDCDFALNLTNGNLGMDRNRDTAVFRILQEALTNVARHAKATHIEIALQTTDSQLILTVRDDGVGIDENKLKDIRSLGLIGMSERAGALGGEVKIGTISEGGTQIALNMPLS